MEMVAHSLFMPAELDELQLRIAQRADQLAPQMPGGPSAERDRQAWLQAETELLPILAGPSAMLAEAR